MHLKHIPYDDYINAKKKTGFNIDNNPRCPLQCPACQRQNPDLKWKIKASKDMSLDDWRKILQFADAPIDKWNFFKFAKMCGQISDPIYHRYFHKLLEIRNAEFPMVPIEISTNGTRKTSDWWDKSFELSSQGPIEQDRWIFALDGTDNYTNNLYRVNSNFDEVYEVLKKGKSYGLQVWWFFLVFEHNKHQVDLARQMARDLKVGFRLQYTTRVRGDVIAVEKDDNVFMDITDHGRQHFMRPLDWKQLKRNKYENFIKNKK